MPGFRPNMLLGWIVPGLMISFITFGSRIVFNDLCPFIIHFLEMKLLGRIYQATFTIAFTLTVALYLWIFFQPRTHSSPPRQVPEAIKQKLIVYETSDPSGTPSICIICHGRLRPLRSRHCLDCGTCKTGFDHHCVWFAQCITSTTTLKPFIQILALAPMVILLGALPAMPIVRWQLKEVVRLTWSDGPSGEFLRTIWWSKWWGWAGGPGWRYAGGLGLGYWHYHWIQSQYEPGSQADLRERNMVFKDLRQPTLSLLILLAFAVLVCLVALAMLMTIIRDTVFRGRNTIDIERSRRWKSRGDHPSTSWDPRVKLWIPDGSGEGEGKVVRLDPEEDVFNNGPIQNWRDFMGVRVWEWFVPWTTSHSSDTPGCEGVEWRISPEWMSKLRAREAFEAPISI